MKMKIKNKKPVLVVILLVVLFNIISAFSRTVENEGVHNFFRSIFYDALFNPFYSTIHQFYGYIENSNAEFPDWFIFAFICQVVYIIVIVFYSTSKKLSFLFTFMLCISFPSLGAFAIVLLLSPPKSFISKIKKDARMKSCKSCGEEVDSEIYYECPHCGNKVFE